VGHERAVGADAVVELAEARPVRADREARDDSRHLAQEVHDGGDVVDAVRRDASRTLTTGNPARRAPATARPMLRASLTGCGPIRKSVSSRREPAPTCWDR
jgi:hypothetical protein